jgi:opacity protein-like surface antigen
MPGHRITFTSLLRRKQATAETQRRRDRIEFLRKTLLAGLLSTVPLGMASEFLQAEGTRQPHFSDSGSPPQSAASLYQWAPTFYLGGTRTEHSTLTISQPGLGNQTIFSPVRFSGRSFDGPLYYGARIRYQLAVIPWLGVETEFIHLKVYADAAQTVQASGQRAGQSINRQMPLNEIVQQYSISHGVNLLLFNSVLTYPLTRQLSVTGRVGVGPTIPHTESTIDGRHQEQYEWGKVAWQGAGGVEIRLYRGLFALLEYKFTRTNQRGSVSSGDAQSLLRTHHGIFGLGYRF